MTDRPKHRPAPRRAWRGILLGVLVLVAVTALASLASVWLYDRMIGSRPVTHTISTPASPDTAPLIAGDCVDVGSSRSDAVGNDEVRQQPCDAGGWFAQISARAPDPGGCPPTTVSRVAVHDRRPDPVLCLVPGQHGRIAVPGRCVPPPPADHRDSVSTVDCGGSSARLLVAFADDGRQCPRPPTRDAARMTGYDRVLCLTDPTRD